MIRVAKEVGTDGKLGGQAEVTMSGTWKALTENVNVLAGNLTKQVRNVAFVTTAVANGDLSQKIDVEARGELLELKSTVNKRVDQLSSFASEVTRVAKEVGVEGKLGGQANVAIAGGTWRDLTDNINRLANNLTGQVRAIMEVSIAVTQGDLTRSISVEAHGEVLALRGNLNQMIANLRDTTQRNQEQLARTSKYKSEFLANMSHELRTPPNSLLILSQLLADNPDGNLEPKQVEFATTIHMAGADLLSLINDILDLSKIESGTMTVELDAMRIDTLPTYVERNFGELARHKGLAAEVVLAADLPVSLMTDPRRFLQVLKNLLANAFKFTQHGKVLLSVSVVTSGWSSGHMTLGRAPQVSTFTLYLPQSAAILCASHRRPSGEVATASRRRGGCARRRQGRWARRLA